MLARLEWMALCLRRMYMLGPAVPATARNGRLYLYDQVGRRWPVGERKLHVPPRTCCADSSVEQYRRSESVVRGLNAIMVASKRLTV